MAFSEAKVFEIKTQSPAIVIEVHRYTKLSGDAGGTVTRGKGSKIRKIKFKSDASATAVIAANRKDVTLTSLASAGSDSLSGVVIIEVQRV